MNYDKEETNQEFSKNISIIGCGNLGSYLAYILSLRSLETDINRLILIDNDIIEEKNLPYLSVNSKKFISLPKVEILKDVLTNISSINDIRACHDTYPDLNDTREIDKIDLLDSYIIDCRDTPSECSKHSIKLNIDGYYGIINRRPSDVCKTRSSRYTIVSSKYYAILFAGIVSQFIFGDIKLKNEKTIIDLRKGELHGILS